MKSIYKQPSIYNGKSIYNGDGIYNGGGIDVVIGDALYIDGNGTKHFVHYADIPSVPNDWYFVAPVAMREGNKVWLLHPSEMSNVKFSSCWAWEVKGITYGSSNTIQFQQRKNEGGTYVNFNVGSALTFTPSEIDDAITSIDTHLRANQGGIADGAVADYNWHCAKLDGKIWVIADFGSSPSFRQYETSCINSTGTTNGITATQDMWEFAGFSTNYTSISRADGINGTCIWNKSRFKQYNTNVNNPTDSLTSTGIYNEEGFNATTIIKEHYGTYDNYLDHMFPQYPAESGAMSVYDSIGKDLCASMNAIEYVPYGGGDPVKMFTAAAYASTLKAHNTISVEGLNEGDWYMPSMFEAYEIFKTMLTDGSDPINATLIACGSSARLISTNRWVPARYSAAFSWNLYNVGYLNANSFYTAYTTCAVALLEL